MSSKALFAGAVLLVVFGARLLIIAQCGAAHPFQDEWVAEGQRVLQRLAVGAASPATFLSPQNEHRLLLTHLASAALLVVNEWEWDLRIGMVLNAAIHALIALLLFRAADSLIALRFARPALAFAAAVVFSLPYAWTNVVIAFSSQYSFHVLCSLLATRLLSSAESNAGLALGSLFSLLSILTVGSGILIPLAAVSALGLRTLRTGTVAHKQLFVCTLLAVFAYATLIHVPEHDRLRPDSLAEFGTALAYALAWPAGGLAFLAIGVVAFSSFCMLYVRGDVPDSAGHRALVAFGAWALLHAIALAYSRGEGQYIGRRATQISSLSGCWRTGCVWCARCGRHEIASRARASGCWRPVGWSMLVPASTLKPAGRFTRWRTRQASTSLTARLFAPSLRRATQPCCSPPPRSRTTAQTSSRACCPMRPSAHSFHTRW